MKFSIIFLNLVAFVVCANIPQEINVEADDPNKALSDILNEVVEAIKEQISDDPILWDDVDLKLIDTKQLKVHFKLSNSKLTNLNSLVITHTILDANSLTAKFTNKLQNIKFETDYTCTIQTDETPEKTTTGKITATLNKLEVDETIELDGTIDKPENITVKNKDLLIKVPDLENSHITLTANYKDASGAEKDLGLITHEIELIIPSIFKYIKTNEDNISKAISPTIINIINNILQPKDGGTTPHGDHETTPTPDSASVASLSLLTLLTALICINFH